MTIASSHEPGRPAFASLDLDWRLLLPPPSGSSYERLLLLGGNAAFASELESAEIARTVELGPNSRSADAVICLSDAGLTLDAASAQVEHGGVLYFESAAVWRLGSDITPTGLIRTLGRRDLTPAGLYWAHPSFTGPRTYFPLDVPGALRWYLRNLHIPATPVPGASRVLERVARIDPRTLGRLAPRLAVFAAARPRENLSAIPFPADALPPALRGPEVRPLLLVHGAETTHAVMLPFDSTSSEPLAVLKIGRRRGDSRAVRAQSVLADLRTTVDDAMRASVPEPLGVVSAGDLTASVESFLPGRWLQARLSRRLRSKEAIEDLELAGEWISDLHVRFPLRRATWSEEDVGEAVDRAVADFVRLLGCTPAETDLFAELRRRAGELLGRQYPVVWQHGDFSSLNVLRSGRRINVVDWEMAGPGLPLEDLLHFTRTWLYLARGADRPGTFAAFRDLFLRRGDHDPLVGAGRNAITRYVRRLELDSRFVPVVLVAGCVRRAAARAEGRRFLRGQPADPRERNRYVTYLELIGECGGDAFDSIATWSAR